MPTPGDPPAVIARQGSDAVFVKQLDKDVAMDIIDVEARLDGSEHPPQRAATILVDENVPIVLDPAPGAELGERPNDATMPVENCASGVEGQHLDLVHRPLPAQPLLGTRAAGTRKFPAISLRRSSSLSRQASRSARIAAPAAVSFQNQSPSCLLDGLPAPAAPASK